MRRPFENALVHFSSGRGPLTVTPLVVVCSAVPLLCLCAFKSCRREIAPHVVASPPSASTGTPSLTKRWCRNPLGSLFYRGRHDEGLFGSPRSELSGKDWAASTIEQNLPKILSTLRNESLVSGTGTIVLNTLFGSRGMGSYPNFQTGCKGFKIPDVRIMAEIFESLGLDFRVLVLVRNARDTLLSTAVHSKYSASMADAADMYESIMRRDLLENQLLRLDPKFYACMDYDNLPEVPHFLGSFLGMDGAPLDPNLGSSSSSSSSSSLSSSPSRNKSAGQGREEERPSRASLLAIRRQRQQRAAAAAAAARTKAEAAVAAAGRTKAPVAAAQNRTAANTKSADRVAAAAAKAPAAQGRGALGGRSPEKSQAERGGGGGGATGQPSNRPRQRGGSAPAPASSSSPPPPPPSSREARLKMIQRGQKGSTGARESGRRRRLSGGGGQAVQRGWTLADAAQRYSTSSKDQNQAKTAEAAAAFAAEESSREGGEGGTTGAPPFSPSSPSRLRLAHAKLDVQVERLRGLCRANQASVDYSAL